MSNKEEPLPFDRPLPSDPPESWSSLDQDKATDSLRRLISQAERKANPWRPQMGEVLGGIVLDISEAESDYNKDETVPLLVVETPSANLFQVFGWHTVLRRELNRKIKSGTLAVGSEIAIIYQGPDQNATSTGRNPTELYQVYVAAPSSDD